MLELFWFFEEFVIMDRDMLRRFKRKWQKVGQTLMTIKK